MTRHLNRLKLAEFGLLKIVRVLSAFNAIYLVGEI
jgi:hypothetical protein